MVMMPPARSSNRLHLRLAADASVEGSSASGGRAPETACGSGAQIEHLDMPGESRYRSPASAVFVRKVEAHRASPAHLKDRGPLGR